MSSPDHEALSRLANADMAVGAAEDFALWHAMLILEKNLDCILCLLIQKSCELVGAAI